MPMPVLPAALRGEEELPHRLEVDPHPARGALAVTQVKPVIDTLATEGVAALNDDGVLLIHLAERAFDHPPVVLELLCQILRDTSPSPSPSCTVGRSLMIQLALQAVPLLCQPLDLRLAS